MPKNTRRQRTKCIFNILITLAAFITTAAVILVYIRFGLSITDVPNSTESIHDVFDVKPTARDRGTASLVTISPATTVAAINSARDEQLQKSVVSATDSQPTSTATDEERQLKRYSATELMQLTSRSLNKDGAQGDHFAAGPSLSRNTPMTLDFSGNSTVDGPHTTNHHNGRDTAFVVDGDDENDPVGMTDETRLHQTSNRQVKHNDYLLADRSATEEDSSVGYHNPYRLSYNIGEYGYKNDDHPVDETIWPAIVKSEPTIPESSWPEVVGGSGGWDRPGYGGVTVDYGHDYKPLVRPPKIPMKTHHKLVQHKTHTIDWQKIGMLALIKLGMVKLKAIGFFKILFLLVFKLKLYMTAVFFKFLLIMKLLKFFKILLMPLFIIRLLPTLFQLLSMSMQLIDTLRRPASSSATSAGSATQAGQSGGLLPSRPGVLRPGGGTSGTDVIGGATGTGLPTGGSSSSVSGGSSGGTFLPARTSGTDLINESLFPGTAGGNRVPGGTGFTSFKFDDSGAFDGQPNDSLLESRFDPALDVFQQVLDSEKCVERIACRIAAAENTGIMPFWINWMLFRISAFIPNDKLESYLKTYKNVNNEIQIKSSTPDSWTTWCSERYDCNNNSKAANTNK